MSSFVLREFWERTTTPIYNTEAGVRDGLEPKPMIEIDLYSVIKQKYIEREVLDEIRAEIKAMSGDIETIADALQIIDKYKAESEVKANENEK